MAIGMIVPDLANVNYATIAQGAEEQAATAGYALLIASGSHTERLGDLHGRIDGLLVGMATSETPRLGDFGARRARAARESTGAVRYRQRHRGRRVGRVRRSPIPHLDRPQQDRAMAGPQNADTARRRLRVRTRARSERDHPCRGVGRGVLVRRGRRERRCEQAPAARAEARPRSSLATYARQSARWRRRDGSDWASRRTYRSSASTTRRSQAISTRPSRPCGCRSSRWAARRWTTCLPSSTAIRSTTRWSEPHRNSSSARRRPRPS